MHNSSELLQLGGPARRKFFQALTIAGAGASSTPGGLGDQNYFWNQVLKPLEDRLLAPVQSEHLSRLIHQDDIRSIIVTSLESLIGMCIVLLFI